MATPSYIFDPFILSASAQVVVFLLQMISTVLQFVHMSGLFLLLRLHVLAPAKELVLEGRVRWVAGHDDRV